MQTFGQGYVVHGEDNEARNFDWGRLKMHNPGYDEIIYIINGEIEQIIDDQPPVR